VVRDRSVLQSSFLGWPSGVHASIVYVHYVIKVILIRL
jgi:hypothetical protein